MLNILKLLALPFFKIWFTVEYYGLNNVPKDGAVILAGNHPSYLDPVLVALPVKRVIRFMAWDALFKVPLLGLVIRKLGAFPVDIRKGKGESAFMEAVKVLRNQHALGIFPEGQRSEQGPMGELRTGTARLAIETNAPIVPITIGGAYRAWPRIKLFPKPAKIIVRYHKPIYLNPTDIATRKDDREYHKEVMNQIAQAINRSLRPALRGDTHFEQWYKQPPSNLRIYEWVPLVAALISTLILVIRGSFFTNWQAVWLPPLGYYLYLITDLLLIKPSRFAKWVRNSAPVWLMLIWHHGLTATLGVPEGEKNGLLIATSLAAFFAFFWEDYFTLQKFVRGLVAVYYLSVAMLLNWSNGLGMFTSLTVFIIAFCFWFRTIYYQATVTVLSLSLAFALLSSKQTDWQLLSYAALGIAIIGYLQTFISAAYDIRRQGTVNDLTAANNGATS
ncbi:MAG: lysophospholipid acyltransferase family protein [Acidobacteriota bacterium]